MSQDDEVRAAMQRILDSGVFGEKSRGRRVLDYIVSEELAERGDRLKAYTIGLDVLERGDDFDPNTDSIVRVDMNRLRRSLTQYYEGVGRDDPLVIDVPKGSYRPVFRVVEQPDILENEASRVSAVPLRYVAVAVVAALMLLTAFVLMRPQSAEELSSRQQVPILDVLPFQMEASSSLGSTFNGIREQLIVDLVHLGTVQVRDRNTSASLEAKADGELTRAEYTLSGTVPPSGDSPLLLLKLTDAQRKQIAWSKTLELPVNDKEFYGLLRTIVGSLAVELASERGVIPTEVLARMDLRLETLGDENSSEYECLMLAYSYDTTKDEKLRQKALKCLSLKTADGSKNSSVWAALALLQFLSPDKSEQNAGNAFKNALASARKAIQLDPYNAVAHENLGSILSTIGNRKGAIAAYSRGLSLAPSKPSLNFLLGWQTVLTGDWKNGMEDVRRGVAMSPNPPGYMRIPIAMDAFRQGNYEASLAESEAIIQLGDQRGVSLAFGAALANGDIETAQGYLAQLEQLDSFDRDDPFRSVRITYSNPSVMEKYEQTAMQSGLLQ